MKTVKNCRDHAKILPTEVMVGAGQEDNVVSEVVALLVQMSDSGSRAFEFRKLLMM